MNRFTLTEQLKISSSDIVVKEYSHISGAKLIYLDNGAEEKTFAAAFKTIPTDSTGVFHILEHSVLSGSENYPVSSPILYMLKNSMQTFLNALTFQGKTVYPCAGCNEKDFENLLKVYLDAVFKPILSHDTFMREGWHLEPHGESCAVSGVVFNEMNGAMSAPQQIVYNSALSTLYPDTYQAFVSGGDPVNIPELTYEKYLETYKEYYSVKNSVLLLSGKQDVEHTLSVIDEYLSSASRADKRHEYTRQAPVVAQKEYTYPVNSEADLKKNTYIVYSYNLGDYGDEESFYAANVLYSLLLADNTSVLKAALLKSGLCEDVDVFMTGEYQRCLGIVVSKTDREKKDEIKDLIDRVLLSLIEKGIEKNELEAVLAEYSFALKEKLSLLQYRAVDAFFTVADNVFFGVPLKRYLECDGAIARLLAAESGYFEGFIRRIFLENNHRAVTVVVPVLQDGKGMDRLYADITAKMGEERVQKCLKEFEDFSSRRNRGDSEEALKKMPCLTKKDLNAAEFYYDDPAFDGNIFFTPADTNGIVYRRDYFSMQGFGEKEIMAAKFLTSAFQSLPTRSRTAEKFAAERRFNFGRLRYDIVVSSRTPDDAAAYFKITSAFFAEKEKNALSLIREMLCERLFEEKTVREVLSQELAGIRMSFVQNGMSIALNGALASVSAAGKIRACLGGYDYLTFLSSGQKDITAFTGLLKNTAEKLFVSARALVGIAAEKGFSPAVLSLPAGEKGAASPLSERSGSVAYGVSSTVNYNVKAMNYAKILPFTGKHLVMSKLLTLGYLWHNVRERGNAYGTNMIFSRDGILLASSYRDPAVKQTYGVFDGVAEFLQSADISDKEIFGCILGIAGEFAKPKTAEERCTQREYNLLCGISAADMKRSMQEVLSFRKEDIGDFARVFGEFAKSGHVCTVGSRSAAEESGLFKEIIDV